MSASNASTRGGFGRTAKMLILGAMVACLGVFAVAGSANAAPASMTLNNGQLNLGFAFKGAKIMPAPASVNLGNPPVATNLPDLWDARTDYSEPGLFGGTPLSFTPAGCATPVTFGVYAASNLDPAANPGLFPTALRLVQNPNPSGAASGGLLVNPLANAGPGSDPVGGRTLAKGAIVPEGTTLPSLVNPLLPNIVGPYPAEDIKWIPYSVGGLPPNPPTTPGTKGPSANPAAPCLPNPPSATVDADLTGSNVVIESPTDVTKATKFGSPSGFRFPVMIVPNPLDGSPVPVTIAATGNVTGTFDAATGAVSLSGPIEARVLTGLASNPLGSYCALPLVGLTLSTTSNADFPGVPFTSGFSGNGALTGTYNITNDANSVGGADCGTVNSVSKGLGSIWLSSGIAEPPVCPEGTTGIPPDCVDIPKPPRISKVTVKGPGKARRGKTATYTVRITNSGDSAAKGVRLRVQGRGIKFNTAVGQIGAKKTRSVKLRIRFQRTGKVNAQIRVTSSNAGSRFVNKIVRVRK